MKILGSTIWKRCGVLAFVAVLGACGDSDPVDTVVFQVIEETTFDASLGIELSAMELLGNGVYRLDIVEGTGAQIIFGMVATVTFTGWLSDGSEFDSGDFPFLMGNSEVISGFEDGILGMRVGGTRRLIIPPNQAYGNQQRGPIPPGSILIFDITLDNAVEQ